MKYVFVDLEDRKDIKFTIFDAFDILSAWKINQDLESFKEINTATQS